MSLQVALLQMIACGTDQIANLRKGDDFCRRAAALRADIALFPEMWNIGYTFFDASQYNAREQWQASAISQGDSFFLHFKTLAEELEMAIALTYLERWNGAPRNTVSVINRYGEIVLTYAKVHTCDFDKEAALTSGSDFHVCDLDTKQGDAKVGAMICFDREFPESARILMLKGAEIILTPNACDLEANRIAQLRARAFENMAGIALTNYAAPQCNGKSLAFDGMAFNRDESSRDMLIIEADESEGIYLAEFDLEKLRAYRTHEVWGNAFRKPSAYGPLTSPNVDKPFVRTNAKR